MSLQEIALNSKALDVALSMSGTRLAVLSDTAVTVYGLDLHRRPLPRPVFLWKSTALEGTCPRQVAFLGDEQVCVLTDSWDDGESHIWTSDGEELVQLGPILEAAKVSSLSSSLDFQKLHVLFQTGMLHEVLLGGRPGSSCVETSLVTTLPSFASEVRVTSIDGKVCMSRHMIKDYN